MSDYVLIHGGSHGAWCWDRVVPILQAGDNVGSVTAVDLLDSVQQNTGKTLREITIADYADAVVKVIIDNNLRNIVLVGHSLAGVTLPLVVTSVPDRIKRVIYLATSNPVVGQSVSDLMAHPGSPMSRGKMTKEMFCNDLDEETTQWLLSNLREEPLQPFVEPVSVCALPEGVPSTYVVLQQDQALLPEYQLDQARNAEVDEIRYFDSGHSAFAAKPVELAGLLLEYC